MPHATRRHVLATAAVFVTAALALAATETVIRNIEVGAGPRDFCLNTQTLLLEFGACA
jgi:hypothetical protein